MGCVDRRVSVVSIEGFQMPQVFPVGAREGYVLGNTITRNGTPGALCRRPLYPCFFAPSTAYYQAVGLVHVGYREDRAQMSPKVKKNSSPPPPNLWSKKAEICVCAVLPATCDEVLVCRWGGQKVWIDTHYGGYDRCVAASWPEGYFFSRILRSEDNRISILAK